MAGVPGAKGNRREEGYLPFVGGGGRRQGWDPGEEGEEGEGELEAVCIRFCLRVVDDE